MSKFVEHHILTNQQRPVERIRLEGNDWYIEVTPTKDGEGLNIISSGGCGPRILVRPNGSNVVEVTTEANHDNRVHTEARRLHEVWVQDAKSPLRDKPTKLPKRPRS